MELRDWQLALKDKVVKGLREGLLVALQSPTGSGKTLFSLVSALEVRPRVLFAVRTHNEFYPVYREATRLGKRFGFVMGKARACLYADEGADTEDINCSLCDSNVPVPVDSQEPPFTLLRELKEKGIREKFCPYFSLLNSTGLAEVIALTYPYVFTPWMWEALGLDLEEFVLVVDEAHNLDNLNELAERKLSQQTLELALKEVKSREAISILERIRRELAEVVLQEERYIRVENYPKLDKNELKLLKDEYDERRNEMIMKRAIRKLHLGTVIKFYSSDESPVFSYRGHLVMKPLLSSPFLSILNRDDLPVILMSGTMPPQDYLSKVLGINRRILYLDVEKELRRKVTGTFDCMLAVDVTSSYSLRSQEMWKRYASYLLRIYHTAKANVLAIFPSYSIMEKVMSHVKVDKYVEGSRTDLEEVIRESGRRKLVIAGVARGKLSEGIELTRDGASVISDVALCGIPYPSFDDYLKLRSEAIYRLTGQSVREALMEIPALIAVKQAIGRAIRSREDHATVWLLDRRFETSWWKLKVNCFNPKKIKL
ncbi:ATP-dependent DNA helicase [Metallosphaera sp. J1]|uniref:helicase C-terminal domain-containing protein n=1 Tax=Metallosphaera javensis (ex Hofmann et al. 2022) TaxID=99938 RepID=UPI001EDF2C59|nr:ATP-dependent DNA helicase [Metallosphaera javensis (ex Hofmann et al. 2022)]MCG3109749.1 ATP-dependent DNA helicase [Metallosphaera javensis (ex Hofmann et al. 2022)]